MTPVKCPNCRLSLPQNWAGMNDPNAKCPYCGKVLASQPAAPGAPAPVPAAPAPTPPKSAARTMLWGVGAPIPGVPPKTVPEVIPQGSAPSPTSARQAFATAATQNRAAIPAPAFGASPAKAEPSQPVSGGADIDVDVDEPANPVPASPMLQSPSKPNQPAATVMFESAAPPADASLAKIERFAPEPQDRGSDASAEVDEPEPPAEPSPRPTPTKSRFKSKPAPKKGYKGKAGKPAKWSTSEEEDADEPKASSSKTPIIVVGAVALVALIGAGVYFLHGKSSIEGEPAAKDQVKAAEPTPAQAEPAPSEKPAALAEKPAPAKPAPAEKPAPAQKPAHAEHAEKEKPAHAEKTEAAEKPSHAEKPVHAEKPAAAEKPKAESAAPEPKAAGGKPSEEDYTRANEAYERGNAKLFQGKTADAIAEFNQALKLNPKDPASHRGLGLAYAQSGKSAEAIKHLKLYLKASPKASDRAIIEKRIDQLHGQ